MKEKLDAIIVLGCGKYESRRKARAAAGIFKEHGSKNCIVIACGMHGKLTLERMFREEAEYIEDVLRQEGVPKDRIRKDKTSRTTYQNLVNSLEFLGNLQNIGVVTSNAHTPRSRILAEKVLAPQYYGRNIYSYRAKPNGIKELFHEFVYMFLETFYA